MGGFAKSEALCHDSWSGSVLEGSSFGGMHITLLLMGRRS